MLSEHASREDPGRLRHLTLDSRISHLGGKETPKGNVPLRIRKGIEAAKAKRQEKSEREAQEAGILMPVKRKSKPMKVRERGLKTPSGVGKFKNGMLKINEREIRRVNNSGSRNWTTWEKCKEVIQVMHGTIENKYSNYNPFNNTYIKIFLNHKAQKTATPDESLFVHLIVIKVLGFR